LAQSLEQLAAADSVSTSELQVDASALEHFDSSALAVLLELRRQAQVRGQSFQVTGMSARLSELASLYGVDELLASPA
jgi:phospholipid transport system transporter-binding protein